MSSQALVYNQNFTLVAAVLLSDIVCAHHLKRRVIETRRSAHAAPCTGRRSQWRVGVWRWPGPTPWFGCPIGGFQYCFHYWIPTTDVDARRHSPLDVLSITQQVHHTSKHVRWLVVKCHVLALVRIAYPHAESHTAPWIRLRIPSLIG